MKPEWEEKLRDIGNKRSNNIYEELLPAGFNRSSLKNDQTRTKFIQDKYISMKYTSEENKGAIRSRRDQSRSASLAKSKEAIAAVMSTPHELDQGLAVPDAAAPIKSKSSPSVARKDDKPVSPPLPPFISSSGAGGRSPRTSSRSNGDSKGSGIERKKQGIARAFSSSSSTNDTSSSASISEGAERPPSRGAGAVLQKWGKSLENVKDSVVKFARND
ncbi:PREDICTED: uncharacterized protein LOC100639410 [Amphimedon queenslandica]|nr:PREDICTED: uncharacterized protein LOC100639410 [Amphimedon queenslandica]|eukprot:XP_011405134.1 PREDICTED: uncharacterized protein LOC100639410 [Amphimedon queenslandica]